VCVCVCVCVYGIRQGYTSFGPTGLHSPDTLHLRYDQKPSQQDASPRGGYAILFGTH